MLYFKRAIEEMVTDRYGKEVLKDVWKIAIVSDDDERRIRRQTFENDVETLNFIKTELAAKYPGKEFKQSEIEMLLRNQSRHVNYVAENFVDEQITLGKYRVDGKFIHINPEA